MNSFGETIRKHRLDKGMPLRQVAGYLGMDQGLLSKMERGIRKPSRELVIKLAQFYETDTEEMLVSWLSDKVLYELEGEENPLNVLRVAEQKIAYQRRAGSARSLLIKNCIGVLKDCPAIRKAWLFGSYARGDHKPGSDIDILIDVPRTFSFTLFDIAEIKEELTRATGREVDVVMKRALTPGVREQITPDMKLLYEA